MRLETERLLLREFDVNDFAAVHEYGSDPEVVRYLVWGPNTEEETRAFLERMQARAAADPRVEYGLAVIEKEPGCLVGGIGIYRDGPDGSQAILGYCFARGAWGRGIATEAAEEMLRFGFGELDLHRVWAGCDTDNAGSIRVLEKLGMTREAHHRQSSRVRGEWRDEFAYAVLENEWRAD